jgi:hypothetical protein
MVEWPLANDGLHKILIVKPTARNPARFGERATPSVMSRERLFSCANKLPSHRDYERAYLPKNRCPHQVVEKMLPAPY